MESGSVIHFNDDKGFGFICVEDGRNLFFHISDCRTPKRLIHKGEKVSFDIKEYPKNDRTAIKAVDVTVIGVSEQEA